MSTVPNRFHVIRYPSQTCSEYVMHRADGSPHILVVEDEADVQQLITFVLERAGYTVTCVFGRNEAEAAIFLHDFDAAVIDLCLPDGRGDQIVRLLRSQSPDTRIVVTSAFAHSSLILQHAAESGDAFVTKPFRNVDLINALIPVTPAGASEPVQVGC